MKLSTEDRLDILELAARYNKAIDDQDVDAWLETWSEEGELEAAFGTFGGREALRGFLLDFFGTAQGKRHWTSNYILEGDGETATLSCDLMMVRLRNPALDDLPSLFATGVYTDALRKVGGAWRFSRRLLVLDSLEWRAARKEMARVEPPRQEETYAPPEARH